MRASISNRKQGYLLQQGVVMMIGFILVEHNWHSFDNFGNNFICGRRGEERGGEERGGEGKGWEGRNLRRRLEKNN